MAKFKKTAKNFEEQLDLLISRGMVVGNRNEALFHLSHLNYYRLAAYWRPFERSRNIQKPLYSSEFIEDTDFDTILRHYLFDRELRLHVLDAIERIEVSFRTQWAYHISHAYGSHGYLENTQELRKNKSRMHLNVKHLKESFDHSHEAFVQHYKDTYDESLPPAWVSCEIMSFGLLSRFYANLQDYEVRRKISAPYQFHEKFLEGLMEHLCYVRNVCAHHGRLWNRHLVKKMPLPKGKPEGLRKNMHIDPNNQSEHKIYNTLVVICHLMNVISLGSGWGHKLHKLIEEYSIDTGRMGFPEDWVNRPIWR